MWVRDLDGPPTLRRRAQVRVENVLGLVEGGMDPRAAVTQVAKSPWVCPQCGAKWVDVVRGSKNCPDCDKLWV